jgi:hypothetical protein
MFSKNPAHHVLVDAHAEGQRDLLSNSRTPQVGLRRFISTTASINSWAGPFGLALGENSMWYFRLIST